MESCCYEECRSILTEGKSLFDVSRNICILLLSILVNILRFLRENFHSRMKQFHSSMRAARIKTMFSTTNSLSVHLTIQTYLLNMSFEQASYSLDLRFLILVEKNNALIKENTKRNLSILPAPISQCLCERTYTAVLFTTYRTIKYRTCFWTILPISMHRNNNFIGSVTVKIINYNVHLNRHQ
jgi:hypothetical protein